MKEHRLSRKLAAYSLAAGAAVVAANAATGQAAMNVYDNGGAGWQDVASGWDQDTVTFKMDGTVAVNSGDTGLLSLGQDADSFTFQATAWPGSDSKGYVLHTGANVGYVAGSSVWNVARVNAGDQIGSSTLPAGRQWSDRSVTETGGLGAGDGTFYFHGEWPFGGSGHIGLYADSGGDRFYGWASIYSPAANPYQDLTLNKFAFSDLPGMTVLAGSGDGDFDGDGDVDTDDIDELCANMGGLGSSYDLDGDGDADEDDMILLIERLVQWDNGVDTGIGTKQGDSNLDGIVNSTDLAVMKASFGASGVGYADGNANCDVFVDGTDLAILKVNMGFIAPPGGGVPEPATLSLLALGATGLMARRRRN